MLERALKTEKNVVYKCVFLEFNFASIYGSGLFIFSKKILGLCLRKGGGGGKGIHFYMLPHAEAAVPGDDPGDDPNSDSEGDPEGDSGDVDDPGSVAHAARHSSSLVKRFSLPLQPRNRGEKT